MKVLRDVYGKGKILYILLNPLKKQISSGNFKVKEILTITSMFITEDPVFYSPTYVIYRVS